MGYAVLHIDKAKGNDSGVTAHIERTYTPNNVDASRTHLNRELVQFPENVTSRTQAIEHRIATAGIYRKVSDNQVRALRFILSGSHEDMLRIEKEGRLGKWCEASMDWLRQTFGAENVVAATLHADEETPHIHATVVPIVQGKPRRKPTTANASTRLSETRCASVPMMSSPPRSWRSIKRPMPEQWQASGSNEVFTAQRPSTARTWRITKSWSKQPKTRRQKKLSSKSVLPNWKRRQVNFVSRTRSILSLAIRNWTKLSNVSKPSRRRRNKHNTSAKKKRTTSARRLLFCKTDSRIRTESWHNSGKS
ncbi:MAG: MobV family relaxase [Bacteroidales bacterium]|nr:plasmid recombination protein [Porphyromonas sp.]MDD6934911.1 MobV family relaxase [Bacteroidales bacterium]